MNSITKSACLFLIVAFMSGIAKGQNLSESQWQTLLPILKSDDSTKLASNWPIFDSVPVEVSLLAVVTGKNKVFQWLVNNDKIRQNAADLSDAFTISLRGGFLDIPSLAAKNGWNPPPEVWAAVIGCGFQQYTEVLSMFDPKLPEVVDPQQQSSYLDVAKWLVDLKVPFDYNMIHLDMLRTDCARSVLNYLFVHDPPKEGLGQMADWMLYQSIRFSTADSVKKLLESDIADPNGLIAGRSMLWHSVMRNEPMITRYLLLKGADPLWQDADSTTSCLVEAVLNGNPGIVRELLPHIKNINYTDAKGNTILHHLADYTHTDIHDIYNRCSTTRDTAGTFRTDHVEILKLLKSGGANFNVRNTCEKLAFERLHATTDTNWVDLVQIFVENVNDQNSLSEFAETLRKISSAKETKLYKTLVNKLDKLDYLVYSYWPDNNTPSQEKDNMMRQLLIYAPHMPRIEVFGPALNGYVRQKSVEMVRFLIRDVIRKYQTLEPGVDVDSLKSLLVNENRERDCKMDVVQELLNTGAPDSASVVIMSELLSCKPVLTNINTCTHQSTLDLLVNSPVFQRAYGTSLLTLLLRSQILNVSPENTTKPYPETGERLRNSLYQFRQARNWQKKITFCTEAMLSGDALITNGTNIQVNVTDYGGRDLGDWPKKACDSIKIAEILNPSAANFAFVYYYTGSRKHTMDVSRPIGIKGEPALRYDEAEFNFNGRTGLQRLDITGRAQLSIPGCVFSDKTHFEFTSIYLKNYTPNPISVVQGGHQFMLNTYKDTVLDRSLGKINLDYSVSGVYISATATIQGNYQYTSYPNLVVPDGNNVADRVRLYLEIARLNGYNSRLNVPNSVKKDFIVTNHILSEYAIQRNFYSRLLEDYKRVNSQLSLIESALTSLNEFYRNFGTLTWENLPDLINQLKRVIASPGTPEKERTRYKIILEELRKTKSLAELSKLYFSLFNNKFDRLIDQYIAEYQYLTLELAQYPPSRNNLAGTPALKLLMENPMVYKNNSMNRADK